MLLSPEIEDVTMLLLYGSASIEENVPALIRKNCDVGRLLGDRDALNDFALRQYLHVGQIALGAKANAMGNLCQSYVHDHLSLSLPTWNFKQKSVVGVSQNTGRSNVKFDLVAQGQTGICCAIEVSFQVTTNSTFERKAKQAAERQRLLHERGHRIAYVVDGAGNFERRPAIRDIFAHSDCTVTFKREELDRLADYLRTLDTK